MHQLAVLDQKDWSKIAINFNFLANFIKWFWKGQTSSVVNSASEGKSTSFVTTISNTLLYAAREYQTKQVDLAKFTEI